MSKNEPEVKELASLYLNLLHKLNSAATPDWLHLDLTFQQMKVLYILKQKGPLKMSELHKELGVSMPTITGIVNRLIERKDGTPLLARETSPEDRREVWARLTEAGTAVTQMVGQTNQQVLDNLFARMTEQDLQATRQALTILTQTIDQAKESSNGHTAMVEIPTPINGNGRRGRKPGKRQIEQNDGELETTKILNPAGSGVSGRRFDSYSTRPILT